MRIAVGVFFVSLLFNPRKFWRAWIHRVRTHHQNRAQIFAQMSKIDLSVIDQMYSAMLSVNESEETIKALRPQVEIAVQELIRLQGKPANFTGILEYHGFHIRVQRPTSYTWEQNTQIQDANLDYYKRLHSMFEQLQQDTKEVRADMKRTAEKLAKAHPNSESIKRGFTIALLK